MNANERLTWARQNLTSYEKAADAARAIGLPVPTYSAHENGSRGITRDAGVRYADFFRVSVEWLLYGKGEPRPGTASPNGGEAPASLITPGSNARSFPSLQTAEPAGALSRFSGPRNVPVHGIAVGGENADFQFNGTTIDYAPRPSSIAHRQDVYVLYVANDSMSPRYEEGEPLYVDPHRTPAIGDYVVLELRQEREGEPSHGFIKKLKTRTPTKIILEQFNPRRDLEFERSDVKNLHREMPYPELLGL